MESVVASGILSGTLSYKKYNNVTAPYRMLSHSKRKKLSSWKSNNENSIVVVTSRRIEELLFCLSFGEALATVATRECCRLWSFMYSFEG
jgi:hypothetical protein